ncbi:MAG: DUF4377 domain-containing protein, partial [Myxococcales bacterium]|nr:DUF4377 domain-containing protein [Myxococcales bacterium]
PPTTASPVTSTPDGVKSVASSSKTAEPASTSMMWVKEDLVDCEGESPQKCMQVKLPGEDDWSWLYDGIEGFDFEEGYRYQLEVRVEEVEDPPADASSRRYHLVKVVEKKKP